MARIILTGVDDSKTALRAAEKAASIAISFGAELHVLSAFTVKTNETVQVLHSKDEQAVRTHAYNTLVARYANDAEHTASTVAAGLRTDFPGLTVISKSIEGAPGAALISEAGRLGAEVIVVGNRRVQGPARVLGSIARTVASEANCDLYVVHTHQR
ncbi:universal stress protein [Citricoccus sp. NPDC079358]|uniref:universal stress protein n=1 Tax=Citricoccus sp. NPDC079358 TaxID=3154653 RepID=UPI00344CF9BA